MLYALSKRAFPNSGIHADDPAPMHLECEELLTKLNDREWFCGRCHKVGRPLVAEPSAAPPQPSAAARMAKRWLLTPTAPSGLTVPSDMHAWPEFFAAYFPQGLWLMSAHNDVEHTIPDDSSLDLCCAVLVENVEDERADLALLQPMIGTAPTRFLRNTVSVRELWPGVLVLGNDQGQFVRLDAHLSLDDLAALGPQR